MSKPSILSGKPIFKSLLNSPLKSSAPCCGLVDKDSYNLSVKSAIALLSGVVSQVLEELYSRSEVEMQNLSFER